MDSFKFQNIYNTNLSFSSVAEKIIEFITDDPYKQYKLTIGSDSEIKSESKNKKNLEIITAIVIYREKFGGRYFWSRKKIKAVASIRDKIYQEVLMSLDAAKYLVPELKVKLNGDSPKYDLEIHIDVGESGATREMIREVVGVVSGFGYIARTKPFSYAASNIADRHT